MLLLILLFSHLITAQQITTLWPYPYSVQNGTSVLAFHPPQQPTITTVAPSMSQEATDFILHAYTRYMERFARSLQVDDVASVQPDDTMAVVTIAIDFDDVNLGADTSEYYSLEVDKKNGRTRIGIAAHGVFGVLRALETLAQLVVRAHGVLVLPNAPYVIRDAPRFAHRGLLLDTARSYLPIDDIKRTMEAMTMAKLNVLHWHVVDAQSFPLQSIAVPELGKGAYSKDQVYSKADVDALVQYAHHRGIRVIPEFDTPGHSHSWAFAFPELVVCPNVQPNWYDFAYEPPSGQLDPTNPKTLEVIQRLFTEQAQWFPDPYFHIGADEVNMKCYESSPKIQAYLKDKNMTPKDMVRQFIDQVSNVVTKAGKRTMVWEEAVLEYGTSQSNDISPSALVVQVWKSSQNVKQLVDKQYKVVVSPSDYWYLDCGNGEWVNTPKGSKSWCDPYKSWRTMYMYNPLEGLGPYTPSNDPASPAFRAHPYVLGGEAAAWAEMIDTTNLDTMVWPRAAAAAETLWGVVGDKTTRTALPRLTFWRRRGASLGIRMSPIQMQWCDKHPGSCEAQPQQ